jgi:hypothetical protein
VFYRREEGAERGPVQRATLGRDNFPELTARQMFEAGMFLQRDMAIAPTGSEYEGVGNQKDFDPNADGVMVHAGCYLVINGKEGGTRSMPVSLETPRDTYSMEPFCPRVQRHPWRAPGTSEDDANDTRAPKGEDYPVHPQAAFCNIYRNIVDAEQALEVTAREYMDSEYTTGGDRMEAIVTNLLIARWQQVHDDMIGDIAWIAIYRDDHKEYGECQPDLQIVDLDKRSGPLDEAYRQLVLHLEIPGIIALLDAQEGRSVRHKQASRSSRSSRSTSEARTTSDAGAARESTTGATRSANMWQPSCLIRSSMSHGTRVEEASTRKVWPTYRQDSSLPTHTDHHLEGCVADRSRSQRAKRMKGKATSSPTKRHPTPRRQQSRTAGPINPTTRTTTTTVVTTLPRRARHQNAGPVASTTATQPGPRSQG